MDLLIQLLPDNHGRWRYGDTECELGLGQSFDDGCELAPTENIGWKVFGYRFVLFRLFYLLTVITSSTT
jgi:hypothetical protein